MAAEPIDLAVEAGATFLKVLEYVDAAGDPVPLTGWTAELQVRKTPRSPGAPLLTTAPVVDGPEGTVTVLITAAQTARLGQVAIADECAWALELTDGTEVIRLAEGAVLLSPELVR